MLIKSTFTFSLAWVRAMFCNVQVGYELVLGTTWFGYEFGSRYELVRVRVGIRYELAWVRVGMVRLG